VSISERIARPGHLSSFGCGAAPGKLHDISRIEGFWEKKTRMGSREEEKRRKQKGLTTKTPRHQEEKKNEDMKYAKSRSQPPRHTRKIKTKKSLSLPSWISWCLGVLVVKSCFSWAFWSSWTF
jgi:hypothetical protein